MWRIMVIDITDRSRLMESRYHRNLTRFRECGKIVIPSEIASPAGRGPSLLPATFTEFSRDVGDWKEGDCKCLDKLAFVLSKPIARSIAEVEPSIGIETGDYV